MTSEWARRALALATAVGAALILAWLSQAPYAAEAANDGLIRLSWRARGERVQECRRLSEEEQAQLPPHMRQPEICEGRVAPYLLSVELDGAPALLDTVRASGARQDRPLYVFRDLPVAPGTHRVSVRFSRLDADSSQPPAGEAAPRKSELKTTVSVAAGEIALITFDPSGRALVLRQATER